MIRIRCSVVCFVFVLLVGILSIQPCYAIKEEKLNTQDAISLDTEKEKVFVSELRFDEILTKAKNHSYDLKIADFEILISKTGITSARSQYYPKLIANAGTEYTHNLKIIIHHTLQPSGIYM